MEKKAQPAVSDLVGALETSLDRVKALKQQVDSTQTAALAAKKDYDAAVAVAQAAHAAYAAHVSEIMTGFAQVHQ